jgi:hypothetical protein
MVTVREVRHFVESRTLAARLTGIFNFLSLLLCLLMDMFTALSGIRIYLDRGDGNFPPGTHASPPLPDSSSLQH